jgi:single-stranded-DNA-specific exonuclease
VIGQDGLKLRLATPTGEIEAIGWGLAPRTAELCDGVSLDVVFRLERDEYNGMSRLQLKLADFRPSAGERR